MRNSKGCIFLQDLSLAISLSTGDVFLLYYWILSISPFYQSNEVLSIHHNLCFVIQFLVLLSLDALSFLKRLIRDQITISAHLLAGFLL